MTDSVERLTEIKSDDNNIRIINKKLGNYVQKIYESSTEWLIQWGISNGDDDDDDDGGMRRPMAGDCQFGR